MKAIDLAHLVFEAFPKQFEKETTKAVWGNAFEDGLKVYEGPRLAQAYKTTMASWKAGYFPKPSDFLDNMPAEVRPGGYDFQAIIYAKKNLDKAYEELKQKHAKVFKTIEGAELIFSAAYDVRAVLNRILQVQFMYDQAQVKDPERAKNLYRPDYLNKHDRAAENVPQTHQDPLKYWYDRAKVDLLPENEDKLREKKRKIAHTERKYHHLKS